MISRIFNKLDNPVLNGIVYGFVTYGMIFIGEMFNVLPLDRVPSTTELKLAAWIGLGALVKRLVQNFIASKTS